LNKEQDLEVDFNSLSKVVTTFESLRQKYKWETNLPYMIAGVNSFPQNEVMELVSNRTYSFNSIVRALNNKRKEVVDNERFPIFHSSHKFDSVLIVGGGESVQKHNTAIMEFIKNKNIAIVHATARNANVFSNMVKTQFFCLVGNEGERIEKNCTISSFDGICVLPPYSRIMETDVPVFAKGRTFELSEITFVDKYHDSCTSLALQIALNLNIDTIYIVGYDGYPNDLLTKKERDLSFENECIFKAIQEISGKEFISLTSTLYSDLKVVSVYQYIN
jgi:4-hydroxy 2-oxovalerate aldolase